MQAQQHALNKARKGHTSRLSSGSEESEGAENHPQIKVEGSQSGAYSSPGRESAILAHCGSQLSF